MDRNDPDVLGTDGKPDREKIAQKLNLGTSVTIFAEEGAAGEILAELRGTLARCERRLYVISAIQRPADAADIASVANWQP